MLDEDVKKMLKELNMNELIEEFEDKKGLEEKECITPDLEDILQNKIESQIREPEIPVFTSHEEPEPKIERVYYRSRALSFVLLVMLGPAVYMYWNAPEDDGQIISVEQEREQSAAYWANEIAKINLDAGRSVQGLWQLLGNRKAELKELSDQMSQIISSNTAFRQEFFKEDLQALFTKYQAIDARHSVEIGDEINALYGELSAYNNPDIMHAFAQMLIELGTENYTNRQVEIANEILNSTLSRRTLS